MGNRDVVGGAAELLLAGVSALVAVPGVGSALGKLFLPEQQRLERWASDASEQKRLAHDIRGWAARRSSEIGEGDIDEGLRAAAAILRRNGAHADAIAEANLDSQRVADEVRSRSQRDREQLTDGARHVCDEAIGVFYDRLLKTLSPELLGAVQRTHLERSALIDARTERIEGRAAQILDIVQDEKAAATQAADILDRPRRPKTRPDASTSRLLRARSTPVPFVPRGALLEGLVEWAADVAPFSIHVVGGQGGAGKTRLGVELCLRLEEETAAFSQGALGFLPADSDANSIRRLAQTFGHRFIVVDYAETRVSQVGQLISSLAATASESARTRIVLLVRRPAPVRIGAAGASPWIDAVRSSDDVSDELLDDAGVTVLDDEELGQSERLKLFDQAVDAFAGETATDRPNLAGALFAQPLMVVMAAFLAAKEGVIPTSRASMFDAILMHERAYWQRSWTPTFAYSEGNASAAVALATLTGTASQGEGISLLRLTAEHAGRPDHELRQLDEWLCNIYAPAAGATPAQRWGFVEPDTLGEYLVTQCVGGAEGMSAQELIAQVLDPGRGWDLTERPLTILGRIAATRSNDAAAENTSQATTAVLNESLAELVASALAESEDPDAYRAKRIRTPGALARLIEAVEPGLVTASVAAAARLLPGGNHEVAALDLLLATIAVARFRLLREASPDVYTPDLAMSLNTYAIRLSEVGRRDEAVAPAEESVALRRRLADAGSGAYVPDLASSLNTYAILLSGVGRRDEAVTLAEESVAAYRRLADANPADYTPNLASSLNTYAGLLSGVGRRDEAVTPAEESVALRRRLADANPAAYAPNLASSLTNYAILLSEVGRPDEAVSPAEEAVAAYRRLADANPAAYTPNLAGALTNYANRLSEVGRPDEAVAPAEESVAAYRRLADANPAAYTPDLAMSLNNYANRLSQVGRPDEAVAPAEEAVALRRRLADANPAAYTPDLAMSLNNYANRLSQVGRPDEAVTPAEEAVAAYRRLADANPAAYTPNLASSLINYANRLSQVGRPDEAVTPAEEAVAAYRRLADANPAAHSPNLATVLINYANRLSEVGRRDEAVAPAEEAVAAYRRLADANPAAYTPNLAGALTNYANRLSQVGRPDEAVAPAEESVAAYRRLADANPAAYTPDLAMSLNNYANRLSQVGRPDEAVAPAEEAVAAYRRLADANPAAYTPKLAGSLTNYANRLSQVGRPDEAVTPAEEAVAAYRRLADANPAAYTPNLASSLTNYANRLSQVGRPDEAVTPAEEADVLRRRLADANPSGGTV